MAASLTRRLLLLASVFFIGSCYAEDKEQAIYDFIAQGKPEEALSVLSLSECELYLEACASLGAGLLEYDPYAESGKKFLSRAAEGGHAQAKVIIGGFLIEGTLFDQDPAAGIALLEEAVELGASEGMFYLANEYTKGTHVEKDDVKALELYARASDMGHIYAPYNAGVLHWDLYKDCRTTERYFELGATYVADALKALEEIRTQEPCASLLESGRYLPDTLFDDVLELQASATQETLDGLYEYGVSETDELKLKYTFNTNDERMAESLAETLIGLGYSSEFSYAPGSDSVYVVSGWTIPVPVSRESAANWTESMCRIGFSHDAEFTGWGTKPAQ
ncbi:MAG: tetratricopeptide repeat protein [Woeseiaceae bacterium]|nr:tetratricopeptide repeat protein [Woeseiaceae bacterium]